jgi:hypothetical protein
VFDLELLLPAVAVEVFDLLEAERVGVLELVPVAAGDRVVDVGAQEHCSGGRVRSPLR